MDELRAQKLMLKQGCH